VAFCRRTPAMARGLRVRAQQYLDKFEGLEEWEKADLITLVLPNTLPIQPVEAAVEQALNTRETSHQILRGHLIASGKVYKPPADWRIVAWAASAAACFGLAGYAAYRAMRDPDLATSQVLIPAPRWVGIGASPAPIVKVASPLWRMLGKAAIPLAASLASAGVGILAWGRPKGSPGQGLEKV
jgi:hypothetical protein